MSSAHLDSSDLEVIVIGEALIDIVDNGRSTYTAVGGSPTNVAMGLGRLGRRVALLTQIGVDPHGDTVRSHVEQSNVQLHITSATARTSTATAHVDALDGQASYAFDVSWDTFSSPVALQAPAIHVGSISAFLEPGARSVRACLRERSHAWRSFDPNIRPALLGSREEVRQVFEETVEIADLVKLSDEDAAFIYPDRSHDDVLDTVLASGVKIAALTRGAGGAILSTGACRVEALSAAVTAVDTIGAGDSFMAALIDRTLDQIDLERHQLQEIADHCARLAGITVSRRGADLPWSHEL